MTKFIERLHAQPLLADGAMGTMLYARGIDFEVCLDALNMSNPDVIGDIHRQYAASGADVIETNTFGANRFKLEHHSLTGSIAEINSRGVEIARQASRDVRAGIYVAGSVGPLGVQLAPLGPVKASDAYDVFYEQIIALADAGVDLLVLETFSDIIEMDQAIQAAHSACDLPIVAQMSFTRDNTTTLGSTPEGAAFRLLDFGVDVIGANCSTGPNRMLDVVSTMYRIAQQKGFTKPLVSAMPNAGFPEVRAERLTYPARPEYFGQYASRFIEAGVRLVGGCCGTTPIHIKSMRTAMDSFKYEDTPTTFTSIPSTVEAKQTSVSAIMLHQATEQSVLTQTLSEHKLVITVEIEPPKSSDTESIEETARMLRDAGATVLDIADSPMARMRMSGLAVAHRVQERSGIETILHFPVRGRNLLRVQGDLLAAHALNVRNVFVIMGDPTRIGDYPQANDHHDIVPTGLAQLIKEKFNQGMDSAGSSIGRPCNFIVGMATNLTPADLDKEAALLHKKIECGADFVITQPIFDAPRAHEFIVHYEARFGQLSLPIISGILPLASVRHAEFMRNEVPGIVIPDEIIERLKGVGNKTRTEGIQIAVETVASLRELISGVYILPAFGRYDVVAKVIQQINSTENKD